MPNCPITTQAGPLQKVIGVAQGIMAMGKAPLYIPVDAISVMWSEGSNLKLHLPTMSLQMSFDSELNDTNNQSQWYVSMDYSQPFWQLRFQKLEARSEDGGLEDTDESRRKRKWSGDDSVSVSGSNFQMMHSPLVCADSAQLRSWRY